MSVVANRQFCPAKDWASSAFGQNNIFQRSARDAPAACALNMSVFQLKLVAESAETVEYSLVYDITSDDGSCYTLLKFELFLNQSPTSSTELYGSEPLSTRRGKHTLTFEVPLTDLVAGDYTLQVQFTGRGVSPITRKTEFII